MPGQPRNRWPYIAEAGVADDSFELDENEAPHMQAISSDDEDELDFDDGGGRESVMSIVTVDTATASETETGEDLKLVKVQVTGLIT